MLCSSVLVDVRLPAKFEEQHPAGAKGVPLYLPIQKWDVASTLRRVGFAFFGIYGTGVQHTRMLMPPACCCIMRQLQ